MLATQTALPEWWADFKVRHTAHHWRNENARDFHDAALVRVLYSCGEYFQRYHKDHHYILILPSTEQAQRRAWRRRNGKFHAWCVKREMQHQRELAARIKYMEYVRNQRHMLRHIRDNQQYFLAGFCIFVVVVTILGLIMPIPR